jgi:hypothetical protein
VKGWKAQVALTPDEAIPQLESHAAAFLYTHVDGEGMMQGFPIATAARLRKLTQRQLIVAGGIRSQQEVDALDALGADAVVGMAVYTELLASCSRSDALRKIVLYSTNGVTTFVQHAMMHALKTPDTQIAAYREEYRKRRDLLVSALNEVGLDCDPPAGAFYAFPNVEKINKNSRTAAQILLEKAHVATIPGSVFGAQGEGHLRFGYAISLQEIQDCVDALRQFLG